MTIIDTLFKRVRYMNRKGRRAHRRLLAMQARGELKDCHFRVLKYPYRILPGKLYHEWVVDPDVRESSGLCRDFRCLLTARHPNAHRGEFFHRRVEWRNEGELRKVLRQLDIPYADFSAKPEFYPSSSDDDDGEDPFGETNL